MQKQLRVKNSLLIYLISITIVGGSFFMGYSLVCLSFLEQYIKKANGQNGQYYLSLATSALPIGALIGSLFYQKIVDRFGDAKTLICTDLVGICSYLLQMCSFQIEYLLAGRLITGIVIGVSLGIVPTYLNSIAPQNMSGIICSFNQLFITIGIAASYAMAFRLNSGNDIDADLFLLLPIIACFIRICSLTLFFPFDRLEVHLEKQETIKIREYLNIVYYNATIEDLRAIKGSHLKKSAISPVESIRSLSKTNQSKRYAVVLAFSIANQFCGINTIFFYAKQMFDKISDNDSFRSNVLSLQLGSLQVVLTLVSGMLLDRFGRKSLTLTGMSIIVVSLLIGFFSDNPSGTTFMQIAVFLHIIGFSLSLGPITVIYAAELLENLTSIMILLWIQTILIALFSDILLKNIGLGNTFLFYAIITGSCLIFLFFNMKQTKGLTRAQVIDIFEDNYSSLSGIQQQNQKLNA